uniref:JmjC domain-containing protein n=1 Tax=Moniliophthora roreri TaxID=221103 RepID=A0A0W0FLG9_MONRR
MRDSVNTHPNPRLTCRGWSFDKLISRGFKPISRVSILDSRENLMKTIAEHETKGIPLIIQDIHKHPKWSDQDFSPEWLLEHGTQELHVRNVHNSEDSSLSLSQFMDKCRKIEPFTQPEEQERFYGKDAPCPVQWNEWLHRSGAIPRRLLPDSSFNFLNYLEEQGTVEHLMCYFGVGDTYTPSHKDLCASSGHNLMAYTEHDGSSFWFMTESGDSRKVTDFFASFGQILDHETHVLSAEQAVKAPLPLYLAEQKLGDLVLVPPRSCHQVVNHGGITIKVSWSRMTLMGLQVALYHELPLYRRVCRRETYKVKWTIYHTVQKLANDLKSNKNLQKPERIVKSLALAVQLLDHILHEEYAPDHKSMDTLSSPVANLTSDDADKFHKNHLGAREAYDAGLQQYMKDESTGAKPNVVIQLSNLVRTFKTCKPFNPRFCRRGWYDEIVLVINVSQNDSLTSDGFNLPNTMPPPPPSALNDGPSQACRRKRKILILDCVSVETKKRSKRQLVTNSDVHDLSSISEPILPWLAFNAPPLSKKPRRGPYPGPSSKTSYGHMLIDTARVSSEQQQQPTTANQPKFDTESSYASDTQCGDHLIINKGKAQDQHSTSYDGPKHQLKSELTMNESHVLEAINCQMNDLQRQVTSLQHQLSGAGPSQLRAQMLSSGTFDAPQLYQISTQLCICTQAIGNLQSLLLPTRQEQGQWNDVISLLKEVVRKIEIHLAQPPISGPFPGLQHHLHPVHGPGSRQDIVTMSLNNGHCPNEPIWIPPPPEHDPRLVFLNSNTHTKADQMAGEEVDQELSHYCTLSPEFCLDKDHDTDELEGVDQDESI